MDLQCPAFIVNETKPGLDVCPLGVESQVDAALDPSHTQNIGKLIKEQFSNAQFLIVSLKDGMFNNANVLFKTQFVDGSSNVRRFANKQLSGRQRESEAPVAKRGRAAKTQQENVVA
jgi:structural maintenance of chromosome 2